MAVETLMVQKKGTQGNFRIRHVPANEQLADVITNLLCPNKHIQVRASLKTIASACITDLIILIQL